jgi:SAM-dependent methyltransferase
VQFMLRTDDIVLRRDRGGRRQRPAHGLFENGACCAPDGANLGLGWGNPQAIAALKPSEVVVDLGCGAGFGCYLAAEQVGASGRVIGVDMAHEMLAKARASAAAIGARNVEFRLGELENLPIAAGRRHHLQCVINLVPDKAQVFREAFRVLTPGGRLIFSWTRTVPAAGFSVSDVANTAPLSDKLRAEPALLCGCTASRAAACSACAQVAWTTDRGCDRHGIYGLVASSPGPPPPHLPRSAACSSRSR